MDLLAIWHIVEAVLGIGLIIFVHEAGHFLAARWCGVRVHAFSLGFGPTLIAWTRGYTTYKICAVPLGGYVRMAGEESAASGAAAEPWELGSKKVGQRFLIFSGGVVANVAFGLVVFPILFAVGIPSVAPVVSSVSGGSPLWHARIEPGSRILTVNDVTVYDDLRMQVGAEVAYGGDQPVELVIQAPGEEEPEKIQLQPVFVERIGFYSIGDFDPPLTPESEISVSEGKAAEKAGLRTGDHFLRVEGQPRALAASDQLSRATAGREAIALVVERDGEEITAEVAPAFPEELNQLLLGVYPLQQRLAGIRPTALTDATGLQDEDRILRVEGAAIINPDTLLDSLLAAEGPIDWSIRRNGRELELESPPLSDDEVVELWKDLFLTFDEESRLVGVLADSAAEAAGLLDGDEVTHIDGVEIDQYDDLREAAGQAGAEERSIRLSIRREGILDAGPSYLEITAKPQPRSLAEYGLGLTISRYTFQVAGTWEAVSLGARSCWNMLRDVGRTLRGILNRDMSEKSVGGVITIGVFAHQTAAAGWVRLFWFLCLLSMNLAFLNILPIPLLDGGHLFFLLIEAIKGSPVNERILGYSQLVGLVLIVSLFVFVIYNDLTIHIFN
jgi:regulator of sigma E protease